MSKPTDPCNRQQHTARPCIITVYARPFQKYNKTEQKMQALSKKGGAMWLFQEMLTCILSSFSGIYYIYIYIYVCVCVYNCPDQC